MRRTLESVPVGTVHGVQKAPVLAFTFTGQAAQYAQMASGLEIFGVFKQTAIDAEKIFLKHGASWKLLDELRKPAAGKEGPDDAEKTASRINDAIEAGTMHRKDLDQVALHYMA